MAGWNDRESLALEFLRGGADGMGATHLGCEVGGPYHLAPFLTLYK